MKNDAICPWCEHCATVALLPTHLSEWTATFEARLRADRSALLLRKPMAHCNRRSLHTAICNSLSPVERLAPIPIARIKLLHCQLLRKCKKYKRTRNEKFNIATKIGPPTQKPKFILRIATSTSHVTICQLASDFKLDSSRQIKLLTASDSSKRTN